jgi:hypothetical protein
MHCKQKNRAEPQPSILSGWSEGAVAKRIGACLSGRSGELQRHEAFGLDGLTGLVDDDVREVIRRHIRREQRASSHARRHHHLLIVIVIVIIIIIIIVSHHHQYHYLLCTLYCRNWSMGGMS